jgi:hypothetical protein
MTTHPITSRGKKVIAAISLFSAFFLASSNVIAGFDVVELDDLPQHERHEQHEHHRYVETNVTTYQALPETIVRTEVLDNIITLTLSGATNYESVEIFHKLLKSVSSIDKLERKVFYITPSRPQSSRSTWKITTTDKDPFTIETELYGLIKNLNPMVANDSLIGLPFTPTDDDIHAVKNIKPYSATASTLTFTSGTIIPRRQTAHYSSDDYSPHLYQGFD